MNESNVSIREDLAIVVLSFDGYSDLWKWFFKCINLYWSDCPYEIFLVTNSKEVHYENVTVIKTGDEISWSDRASTALSVIKNKYVLLLLEDYLIGKKVDNNDFNNKFIDILLHKCKYYRLSKNPPPRGRKSKLINAYEINENEEYGINLQPAIWEKDFLINLIGDGNYNAWEFEIDQLKKTYTASNIPMEGCYVDNGKLLFIYNGVLKGKWIPSTLKYFRKQGIIIECGQRENLKISEEWNHIIRTYIRNHIPYCLRKIIKKIMLKLGAKFVTKY